MRSGADPLSIGRIGWRRAGAIESCLTVQRAEEKQEGAAGRHAEDTDKTLMLLMFYAGSG